MAERVRVVLIADAGERSGLGHLSRCGAVGVALRARGVGLVCFAVGRKRRLVRDGLQWKPVGGLGEVPVDAGHAVVLDSYGIGPDEALRHFPGIPLAQFDDMGTARGPDLTVDAAAVEEEPAVPDRLVGLRYAAVRPRFWGHPPRRLRARVERVLVTLGGGGRGEEAHAFAAAARAGAPGAEVRLVQGPHADLRSPRGVRVVQSPAGLWDELRAADLLVCAAGQTLLEGAVTGTPTVAVALVENQRRQARRVYEHGAALVLDASALAELPDTVALLAGDLERRTALSRSAQEAVDGHGALRIAFRVHDLARSRWASAGA